MRLQLFGGICLVILTFAECFTQRKVKTFNLSSEEEFEEHLILTPLLEEGKFKEAQKLSKVTPKIGNVTSYSGFFTVNKACKSNIWFWFFPASNNWETKPLLLWLQGGPGASSLFGLFEELGPFMSYETGLKSRKYSWHKENNLLFIDQPVGTGYSYTEGKCYPENETAVGKDLYNAVFQFHQLFPNFVKNKFFICGESYAGHYIPALAYTIDKFNPNATLKINLTGMLIGGSWSDPRTQSEYGDYLYQHGLIDTATLELYKGYQDDLNKAIDEKDWKTAGPISDALMVSVFDKFVGDIEVYNYAKKSPNDQNWPEFIQSAEIRRALHVGNLTFQAGDEIYNALYYDIVQSVKPWVQELLEKYSIVFYNGQFDIICGYPMLINFLRSLKWSGQSQYLNATRQQWCVQKELAGYFKGEHNLYEVLVRDAGHFVPADQPKWAYTLVKSITSGTVTNPLHGLTPC